MTMPRGSLPSVLPTLIALAIAPPSGAATLVPFHTTESGNELFTLTSPRTNHAVAVGTGTGTLGSAEK